MPVQIQSMTLAATDIESMATFYNAVLETNFEQFELFSGCNSLSWDISRN